MMPALSAKPQTEALTRPGRALRALVLGIALGAAFPVAANTLALTDSLADAQRLVKQKQYPQALEKIESHLSQKPRDAQGRFLKGVILTEMGKPAEAITVFSRLTEDYPELPEPYNNLAVLYAQQKQYDKARTALEMAIRTHPSYAIAYENLGDVYAKLASQAYDKALQIDSGNSGAQNKLSLIRDLISTSGKPATKPAVPPAPVPATPVAPAPAAKTTTPAPVAAAPATPAPVTAPAPAPAPVATPVEAKPQPAPAAKPEPGNAEVANALANWADAWSSKNVKAYLAAYAGDFNPPKGMPRRAWEAERTERIAGKAGKISVTYDEPQIAVSGDKATVKFRQHYKAPGLSNSTNKTLVFVRTGGKWLIQEEIAR